jgi:hypothetical protein
MTKFAYNIDGFNIFETTNSDGRFYHIEGCVEAHSSLAYAMLVASRMVKM